MKRVLYIDACIRKEDSRTKRISDTLISELEKSHLYNIERVDIESLDIKPLNLKRLNERGEKLAKGLTDDKMFDLAKQFASADYIVVSSPYWDMNTPALLKIYFENVSVAGITFKVDPTGDCIGICKAEKLIYITTRGMNIKDGSVLEQGGPYFNALRLFFGIDSFKMISTYGLDMVSSSTIEERISVAKEQAVSLARSIIEKDQIR